MMIYNTREKKTMCGFGWDEDLAVMDGISRAEKK